MKYYKKVIILILVNFFILVSLSAPVKGAEGIKIGENNIQDEKVDETTEKGLENLYDYINKRKTDIELMNELDPSEYIKSYIKNGKGNITVGEISKALIRLLF